MKVSILQPKGYCAGVARAINIALQARKEHPDKDVSVLSERVKNQLLQYQQAASRLSQVRRQ